MKTKRVVKFLDLVLRTIMKGPDAIMKCRHCEVLVQRSGDDAGGILGSETKSLR